MTNRLRQVLFISGVLYASACRHLENAAVSFEKEETLSQQIDGALDHSQEWYQTAGAAVGRLANNCQAALGVLPELSNENLLLMPVHCLPLTTDPDMQTVRFSSYCQKTLPLGGVVAEGYGFPSTTTITFSLKSVKMTRLLDIAYVRGVFPNGLPAGLQPLKLARSTPKRGQIIFFLHRHIFSWWQEEDGVKIHSEADLLTPAFGFSFGSAGFFWAYTLPTNAGDSGTVLLNTQAELVGIVSQFYSYKKAHISTYATRPEDVRLFIKQTWDK